MPKPDAPDFAEFWFRYPRRVGKLAARQAYHSALKLASAAEILAGLERYLAHKPSYADWCHPVTFLRQGRWMDEYDPASSRDWQCPHTPHCQHRAACRIVSMRKTG